MTKRAQELKALLVDAPRAAELVREMAIEIQEVRQRRCGNCRHMARQMGVGPICMKLPTCNGYEFSVSPDWFCADFEERK